MVADISITGWGKFYDVSDLKSFSFSGDNNTHKIKIMQQI